MGKHPTKHRLPWGPMGTPTGDGRLELRDSVVCADNLDVLRGLPDACLDLVYIDPPFASGQRRVHNRIRTGTGTSVRRGFGDRSYNFAVVDSQSFDDTRVTTEYLAFLTPRLAEIHRVLRSTGSLFVHLDHHIVHRVRCLLDDIFGAAQFRNEIIWAYDFGGRSRRQWPRKHDNILWYARSDEWTFNRDDIDRLPYMAPGLVGPEKAARGKLPTDVWWMTIVPTSGRERTGYPTQKPLRLLERIIRASSNPGDVVADFFCGSGTTAVAAASLGRRYLAVDSSADAVRITEQRLADIEAGSAH